MALRERIGGEASPSAAVLDSKPIKSAEKGAVTTTKWVTPGKQVKSRKIHARVDSEGLPTQVVVHFDDGAGLVLDKIRRRFPWLDLISPVVATPGRLTLWWQRRRCCA